MQLPPYRYEDVHFVDSTKSVWNYSFFQQQDLDDFKDGIFINAYKCFGAHPTIVLNTAGYYFSVWAPNATYISIVGNFNQWNENAHPLFVRLDKSGIWEGFIPHLPKGELYKFHIVGYEGLVLKKGDPFAWFWELRPHTASITWDLEYHWKDGTWMADRKMRNSLSAPWSVYEVHLGSWMKPDPSDEESFHTYGYLADRLVGYVKEMGFTHVELMPVAEFPYDGSWGYQGTGYFAPTSRFGNPQDFMYLVDRFHQEGIGVIMDWVPAHFPYDEHGLYRFDGTNTYEYADYRKGFHPDWNSYIFNYARGEVRSFLLSNAHFWMEHYHIDGLRVDAVSSMLKLNYSRKEGEWEPNEFGGDGNIEAIEFIKLFNTTLYKRFEGIQTIAEEATDWPGVSKPIYAGGLGFGMKWMMGWMHDTLKYFKTDPFYRSNIQDQLTFSIMYYYDENFMLPLSHDEVVHGKSPMIYKMPGNEKEKFAGLRSLYGYMYTHPGGKLLFMGNEFGSTTEWNYKTELPWGLLQYPVHAGLQQYVKALNELLVSEPALYEKQFDTGGFEWVDLQHRSESVIVYRRKTTANEKDLVIILNLTPVARFGWEIVVYGKSAWKQILTSDDQRFGGDGVADNQVIKCELIDKNSDHYKIKLDLPALSIVVLK
ncbi:1,4-alpha-glucan branching protein GlgB [Gynurincola endophyticus]|uniref:1,4-alpha-glucan branching protein GlgB n=1 Tax=Gynurincola endophyticus TaxID=2479004 RepID=UPI000F8D4B1A|nr:1,4-alpha-glucan branching protein GlgB [Gynurincola endophyticus]